ncbi:hypothetical protein ACU5AX_03920 [Sphingomonas sp. XXL09]|uniref:hypothetical protein n=1 Tax=Sphingomonas sp. XXL09 TaxID=3457787 RepID=UPI00406BC212
MNPAEVIVAVVALVVFGIVMAVRSIARNSVDAPRPPIDETRRLYDEVRILKERVQVLERVITDNRSSIDLDREIDRLRDR